jgi:hypothetical protein
MAANPQPERPLFRMIVNGSSYLFVKLLGDSLRDGKAERYGTSDLFATRSQHRNNLYEVLVILRHLGQLGI